MKKSTWVFIAVLCVIIAGGLAYRHFAQERDSRGATRLMRALEENDTEKMEKLLNEQEVILRDKSGQTALFYAARHVTQPQVIHKLLLAGADPLATDKLGNTPLMVAAQYNPAPAITLVLARQGGSSPAQQHNKNKALLLAAKHNSSPVIKTLLIAHASPHFQQGHEHYAADYLVENEQLSEQEKIDLRQAMLLLEILEEREKFFAVESLRKPQLKQMDSKPETPKTSSLGTPALPKGTTLQQESSANAD
ncbi:MAG: ankyrin repeat domain-containing protein [Elusimicrobiaceae bacterium]|nr:ankyrin repeat domain-containing protein [Elusimicrobiaceae bacterium]